MLASRNIPPKKIPRNLSADEYFFLAVQYFLLGWLRLALKASTKAIAGRSAQGRQFILMWSNRSGADISAYKLNKAQYFLVWLGLCTLDLSVSIVVPIVKGIWNIASSASKVSEVLRNKKTFTASENSEENSNSDIGVLPRLIARTIIPDGLTAEDYLKLGKQYKQNGWIGQSQEALKRAQQLAPSNSPTAEESYKYLKTKVPHAQVSLEVEAENINGYHAMAKGDLPKCKEIFGRLMKDYPDFEWPYLNLATAYTKDGQISEAKFLLRKLISINPEHVEAWASLARIHAATFEIEEARQAVAQANELYLDPNDSSLTTMIDCLAAL